jgi:probable F420-dependent oxidoreductase
VQFGVALPNFQFGAPPTRDHIIRVAQAAEEAGYTSVWTSDHILVGSAYPRYGTVYESLITLTWVAAHTRSVRVGTSILVLPMRNAALVAKQVATLDDLAGGRTVLGVGVGWNQGEYSHVSADWSHRGRLMDESLRVIRNLWTEQRPSFKGTFYRYEDTLFYPKPLQRPGPPIWVGGNSQAAMRRAAEAGDAWHGDEVMPDAFGRAVDTLGRLAARHHRAVAATVRFTVDLFSATGSERRGSRLGGHFMSDGLEIGMKGSFTDMVEFVRKYRDMGATDFICQFEHDTEDQHVDFVRTFAREVIASV